MNDMKAPLWQYMGQQQPMRSQQAARQPYMAALERKRKRQMAKQQTQQQEARILPVAPARTQPFSSYLASQIPTDQTAGMMPWVSALRAR